MNKAGRLLLLFCFVVNTLQAQDIETLRKQYPDEKAVMLNRVLEYTIEIKNGVPYVESRELEQIQYLLGTATAFMGRHSFFHSYFEEVISYDAYTRTPDDKKLKVTNFQTNSNEARSVFYNDTKETTFQFPSVVPGAVGNLNVAWINKDPHLLSPFYFTTYIPTINSELRITASKDINLKYHLLGIDTSKIIVKVEAGKRGGKVYTFQSKNSTAERSYNDAPGYAYYLPHVIFYIDSYKDKGVTVPYLSNADDLYRLNYSYIKAMEPKPGTGVKEVVDSLIKGLTTDEEKARSIYSWVQRNIKYVAFEDGMGGFIPRPAELVCKRRFGDCKDMSSIMTEMLKTAGLKTYFTWIGTRRLPYKYSKMPLPMVSNHMICTVDINGKLIFLDGTDPTCVFGIPSSHLQDKEAMISINENEYKIVTVPTVEKEKNTLTDTTWLEITAAGIKGKIRKHLTGYFATDMHGKLIYRNKKNMQQYLRDDFERGSNKFQLEAFDIDERDAGAVTMVADFLLPDYIKKHGDEYYLNLNLFKFFQNEQIDHPKRKIPVENDFNFLKKYVTLLRVPDGYKISYMPPGKSYRNSIWGFNLKYEQKDNWVILTQEYDNNTLLLANTGFSDWNKVLENLYPLYKETLSLTKI
ncbi:DUF3857 domain-containing protein [Mucilaginibacter hurinus]|nr:DUF3857 domain-containing protein [Mucilaginibacter hurinus]